jgi:hypothetical protein
MAKRQHVGRWVIQLGRRVAEIGRLVAKLVARLHCKENPIYVFLFWELLSLRPNCHIHVSVNVLYIPRIGPHISLQQNRQTGPRNLIILSQIYECRNWETEHYNSVFEITVSFLGIHKWEPDIYIIFHRPFICSLLATATLWVRIQTSLKIQDRRNKQKRAQHSLAHQKI